MAIFSIQWLLSLFSPLLQDPQQRIDNLRKGANDQGSQSIRDFKSADRAYKNAKHGQAKSLSIKAREHQAEMNKLNKQAEDLVYSMRNSNPKQAEIEIGEPERVRERESKQSLSLFFHRFLIVTF